MTKNDKAIARLLSKPKDFHYDEARSILLRLGFIERNKGMTSGSRVEFIKDTVSLMLHRPHPNGELKTYQVKQLIEFLQRLRLI